MSYGEYVAGVGLVLAAVLPLALGAAALRARVLPTWTGSAARVAEAVIAVSGLLVAAELVGVLGLFRRLPLVLTCVALGLVLMVIGRRRAPEASTARPHLDAERVGAIAVGAVVILQWAPRVVDAFERGMLGTDTLRYHGPVAARFVQDHSITSLHFISTEAVVAYFPFNSELLHAVGMLLMGSDVLSPLINLGWVALALISAWSIGRTANLGLVTLLAVGAVLAAPALSDQAGTGDTDIVAVALLLAALALLLNGGLRPAPVALAGLAAGLAVGTKLTVLAAVLALTLGVVVLAVRDRRWVLVGLWSGGLLATGGYWYLRNAVEFGNPLPWFEVHAGPLSLPGLPPSGDETIMDYAFDPGIWVDWFDAGFRDALGNAWWAILALALVGAVASVARGRTPLHRWLGVVGVAAFVAYLFTPGSAAGAQDLPIGFSGAVRFAAPALAIGLCLLPLLPRFEAFGRRPWVLVAFGLVLLLTVGGRFTEADSAWTVIAIAAGLAVAALVVAGAGLRFGRGAALAASSALLLIGVLGLGWQAQRDYLDARYAAPPYAWAGGLHDQRIALTGTSWQYPLYGNDLSNHVQFVGRRTADGEFEKARTCRGWRSALNAGHYDYAVAAAGNFLGGQALEEPEEVEWTGGDPHAVPLLVRDLMTVFRLTGPLDPAGPCRWRNRTNRTPAAIISARLAEVSRCLGRTGLTARRTLTPGSAPYSARKVSLPGGGQAIVYAFASRSAAAREEDGIATFFSAGSGRTERFGSVIVGYVARVSAGETAEVERCL